MDIIHKKITSNELLNNLKDLKGKTGQICFKLAGINLIIKNTDTIGVTLQLWLKEYFNKKNYFYMQPSNTQEFPDFYLNDTNPNDNMLEIKSFNYKRTPSFDIANFDSYCSEIEEKPYCLYADYLIFGYNMEDGIISIKKMWLKKVWEISGTSKKYPLKVQEKRNKIYNIRPNSYFKNDKEPVFKNEIEFLTALFETIKFDKGEKVALKWKKTFICNYKKYYNKNINF